MSNTVDTTPPPIPGVAPVTVPIPNGPTYEVSDIPTVTLPLSKATKAHIAAIGTTVLGAGELAAQIIPEGTVRTYVMCGVGIVTIALTWMGVYVAPNLPKITKR